MDFDFSLFCVVLSSLCILTSSQGPQPLPNINNIQYGFNIFIGDIPHDQRQSLIGDKLFDLSITDPNQDPNLGEYFFYDQLSQNTRRLLVGEATDCSYESKSSQVSWSVSSNTLRRQSQSSSNGFDKETTLGISGGTSGLSASAETTVRDALIFGNSETSENARKQSQSKHKYLFDASLRRTMYAVRIEWDSFEDSYWNNDFKNDLTNLGTDPSINEILLFWQKYGTHGLDRASMGQVCHTAVSMEAGFRRDEYNAFGSTVTTQDASFMWFGSSNSQQVSDSQSQVFQNSFTYTYTNRQCDGTLDYRSPCVVEMNRSFLAHSPAIIEWTYKPIWEMNVPGFDINAKNKMKQIAEGIFDASKNCRDNKCNGRGTCTPNKSFWANTITLNTNNYDSLWDYGTECFCDDGYVGNNCQHVEGMPFNFARGEWSNYQNDWRGGLFEDYAEFSGRVICGISSYHSNSYEDRKFRFRYARPATSYFGSLDRSYTGWHTRTSSNDYFKTQCNQNNEFIVSIRSWYIGSDYDREFQIRCASYEGSYDAGCKDYQTDWVNTWDDPFDFTCDWGYALSGIESTHYNFRQDRKYKFKCCKMAVPAY